MSFSDRTRGALSCPDSFSFSFFFAALVLVGLAAWAPGVTAQELCDPNPCLNGGLCTDDGRGSFSCRCPVGTSGELCEILDSACLPNPCQNSGVCVEEEGGTFSCECQPGTSGELCEVIEDPCLPNPCLNDGTCINEEGGDFSCRCDFPFGGELCELIVDVCDPNPCQNGGSCNDLGEGAFSCTCPADTSGELCEITTTESCEPNPCQNGGECEIDDEGLSCRCPIGFGGPFCETPENPCEVIDPCLNGGVCTDEGDGTSSCACPPEFTGEFCETEIGICSPNPCLNGGFCFEFNGAPFCNCPLGTSGTFCEEVDPCLPNPCLNDGTCLPQEDDTFLCECPEGIGGELCDLDLDPCDPNPCLNEGVCSFDGESTSCACPGGFDGELCEIVSVDTGIGSFFDEGVGIVTDFRSGLTGVLEGDADWGLGQQGSALVVSGAGYVEVDDAGTGSPLDITGALSIALWIRPDDLGGTQILVSKDDAYELEIGKLSTDTWNLRLDNVIAGVAGSAITEGVWQHLAATWDGTTVTFYVNGQADGSAGFSGPIPANDNNLGVGARPTSAINGGPAFFFAGAVDDVRIFDRALTAQEVADLFTGTVSDLEPPVRSNPLPGAQPAGTTSATLGLDTDEAASCRFDSSAGVRFADMAGIFPGEGATEHREPLSGLSDGSILRFFARCQDSLGNRNGDDLDLSFVVGDVDLLSDLSAFWTFDEGSGCTALDATTAHDGALGPDCLGTGNAPQYVAGINGTGLLFDGSDDEVAAPSSPALATPSELTLAAWIRHGASFRFESIIDHRDAFDDGYDLYLTDQSTVFMRVASAFLAGTVDVGDGEWHHVVGVYSGSEIRIYVDGILDNGLSISPQTVDVEAAEIFLGRHFAESFFGFGGSIDEVMIYGRALSEIEVFETFLSTQP